MMNGKMILEKKIIVKECDLIYITHNRSVQANNIELTENVI